MVSASPVSVSPRSPRAVRPKAVARAAQMTVERMERRAFIEPLEDRRLLSVSLISAGLGGAAANGTSGESSVSADGRFVAFSSSASNLVASDTNGAKDIFLRDTQTSTTYLISATSSGGAANGQSFEPIISGDGNWIAFRSEASNLVANDANGASDIFLTHIPDVIGNARTVNTTIRVSVSSGGAQANGFSGEPTISFDGRYVAYSSFASNLVSGDGNSHNDVFRYDRTLSDGDANKVVLVSKNVGNTGSSNGTSFDPSLSADGNFVAFHSDGTDLVATDANGAADVFERNVTAGTTTLISATATGATGDKASSSSSVNGATSGGGAGSGRYVVFRSSADNLTTLDTNGQDDVFLRDTQTGQTTLLSSNQARTASGHGASKEPSISADAHFAAFTSTANDLVTGDSNNQSDIFVRDLQAGPVVLLSLNTSNQAGNGASSDPYISADGRFVSFTSTATDLTAGDTNAQGDIFLATTPTGPGGTGGGGGGSTPDTAGPSAAVSADQIPPDTGDTVVDFDVNIADNVALNTVTIGNVQVITPGGATLTATPVKVIGSGASAVVTYEFTAPNGALTPADSGTYTIHSPAGAFTDTSANPSGDANIGTIALNIVPATDPDFVPFVSAKLPKAVIGGVTKGSASVKVVNQGTATSPKASVTTSLYLSDDNTFSSNDTLIRSVAKTVSLKHNKSFTIKFNFVYPGTLGSGNYYLIGRADTANVIHEPKERNNTAASATSVTVAPPFVDLHETVSVPTGKLVRGGKASAIVTITNSGNVTANSKTETIVLSNSADQSVDSSAIDPVVLSKVVKLGIKAGKVAKIKLSFVFPSTLDAGTFFLTANVDANNVLAESEEANNTAVSASQYTLT